jgi:ABC-2 type transport system ATP-binding protein
LDEDLTAFENLELHAAMYGMQKEEREKRIIQVIEIVELKDRLQDVVKTFSGGMRRRLEIARGLMHYPKILFLDEPTIGLDPQTRKHIWEHVRRIRKEHGITIVLTTHYMDEADGLCDRIAIIDHGKIIALDKPDNLKNSLGGDTIRIRAHETTKLESLLKGFKGIKEMKITDGELSLRVEMAEKKIADIIGLAKEHNIHISSVSLNKPTLDDVFLHYTGRTIRDSGEDSGKESMKMRMRAWGHRK